MLKTQIRRLTDYLRIDAVRRLIRYVEAPRVQILWLVVLAVLYAAFEGMGISLLLPILQFAEDGQAAFAQSSGAWAIVSRVIGSLEPPFDLVALLALAFVPILLRQAAFFASTWYSSRVAAGISVRMRMQTLDAVLDADPGFFEHRQLGDVVGILVTQATSAGIAILTVVKQLAVALLIVAYVGILLALSVPLTFVTVAFAVLVSWAIRASIRHIRDSGVEFAAASQVMSSRIVERLGLIRLVKLRDQKRQERDAFAGYSETLREIQVRQGKLGGLVEITADPLLMLSAFMTLYVGIGVLGMTLAQLGLVMFVLTRLNTKLKEFSQGLQTISQYMGAVLLVRRLTQDAERANTIHRGRRPFAGVSREIEFDHVTFCYASGAGDDVESGVRTPALRELSLTIRAGSFTAVVGRSGAGKSTLVELLPRLRDVTEGTIRIDGVDLREFDVGSLRRGIGYLTQDAMLFNDSVRENLVYGLGRKPSDAEISRALEDAYATFVYDLPQGLDTRMGDQGVLLSGGERQRISLARVLLADTSMLILDEPTSALDSESESYIQEALSRLHGKKTIIVIAHRLATVIQSDQLLVMENGRVVERGTHEELIAKGDVYRGLFDSQLLAP